MLKLISFLLVFVPSSWACSKDAFSSTTDTADGPGNSFGVNKTTLVQLVNDIRQKGCNCGNTYMPPVPPITWNDQLAQAALNHSKDMNSKKYFSHKAPDGSTPGDRIRAMGYTWRGYGENIAFNYPDEDAVVAGWLKSVNHCKTIMTAGFREMGVGRAGEYWTQDFGVK